MELVVKEFYELSTNELYEILKSRAEVFVVEQNCVYQDLDDIDYNSLHVFYKENERVIAYLRIFKKPNDNDIVQIGRVLTLKRGEGLGKHLLEESINIIKQKYELKKIYIEAQKYVINFYEKFGFQMASDEFLEDGIPHIAMELDL